MEGGQLGKTIYNCVAQEDNYNYVAAGYTQSKGDFVGSSTSTKVQIFSKYDYQGNLLWGKQVIPSSPNMDSTFITSTFCAAVSGYFVTVSSSPDSNIILSDLSNGSILKAITLVSSMYPVGLQAGATLSQIYILFQDGSAFWIAKTNDLSAIAGGSTTQFAYLYQISNTYPTTQSVQALGLESIQYNVMYGAISLSNYVIYIKFTASTLTPLSSLQIDVGSFTPLYVQALSSRLTTSNSFGILSCIQKQNTYSHLGLTLLENTITPDEIVYKKTIYLQDLTGEKFTCLDTMLNSDFTQGSVFIKTPTRTALAFLTNIQNTYSQVRLAFLVFNPLSTFEVSMGKLKTQYQVIFGGMTDHMYSWLMDTSDYSAFYPVAFFSIYGLWDCHMMVELDYPATEWNSGSSFITLSTYIGGINPATLITVTDVTSSFNLVEQGASRATTSDFLNPDVISQFPNSNSCIYKKNGIITPLALTDYTYYVGTGQLIINNINAFQYSPYTCADESYLYYYQTNSPVSQIGLPSFITSQNDGKTLVVETTDTTLIGQIYEIQIKGYLTDYRYAMSNVFKITLGKAPVVVVVDPVYTPSNITVLNNRPLFLTQPQDIVMNYSTSLTYKFPSFYDPDGQRDIKLKISGIDDYSILPSFVHLQQNQLFLIPTKENVGVHYIKVTLYFTENRSLQTVQNISITVLKATNSNYTDSTNNTNDTNSSILINETDLYNTQKTEGQYLTAKIISISSNGTVLVQFSEEIRLFSSKQIEQYQKAIKVTIKSKQDTIDLKWNVTQITQIQQFIQLDSSNSYSLYQPENHLKFTLNIAFIENGLYIGKNTRRTFQKDYSIQGKISAQSFDSSKYKSNNSDFMYKKYALYRSP